MLATGRRILITGGSGAIGVIAARVLADAGAIVIVNDILPTEDAHARLADERIHYVRGDGSDESEAARIVSMSAAIAGPLTDVVLLAGIVRSGGLLEQSADDFRSTFEVNVIAAAMTAQAAVREWKTSALPGNLVFISSWVQDVPWPGIAPYTASKAALRSLAKSFAREFAVFGIRANVLAPGIVGVGMARTQWENEPDYRQRARRAVPLGRLQDASSVADALVFLCSPMSSYMTGSTLVVDGGASLYPLDPEELADVDDH